jgi:hypothetical protein
MGNVTLKKFIEDFKNLPIEEKEYALEIVKKQIIEEKRDVLAKRAKEANNNYRIGNIKTGDVKSLYKDLESD